MRRAEEILDLLSEEEISRMTELLTSPNLDFPKPEMYIEEELYDLLKIVYSNRLFMDREKIEQMRSFFQIMNFL